MKIVIISQDFYPMRGGIANYLLAVYNKYFSKDQFLAIIPDTIQYKSTEQDLKFEIFRTKFEPFKSFEDRSFENNNILNKLIEFKPDLILFGYIRSHPEVGIEYKKINSNCKIGLITHAKEVYLNEINLNNSSGIQKGYTKDEIQSYTNVLNKLDIIFTVSNFTKELLLKQNIKNKIEVLNPPLNFSYFNKKPTQKDKSINIISVGRLIERKGHSKVIEVIKKLLDEGYNINYNIIGYGQEEENILKQIKNLNLNSNIKLYTNIGNGEMSTFYQNSDIFILNTKFIPPNDIEGFGIVFLEANYFELPVIGGNSGGVRDAIIHNKTGLLIEPDSFEEIYLNLKKLLNDKELRTKLGKFGKKRVLKDFNGKYELFFDKFKL